jgi:hypothetical protein
MTQTLFPHFLDDPDEYRQAETLWRERWEELVRRVGQGRQWVTPWLTTTFADGTPFADGNPIFSAVAPDRRLGVRVIQVEPAENPHELAVWTDTFAEGEPEAVKELVLTCALTQKTLGDSLALMERWITKEEVDSREDNPKMRFAPASNDNPTRLSSPGEVTPWRFSPQPLTTFA